MKSELEHKLDLLRVTSKQSACLEIMLRVRNTCIGMDAEGWAFHTGKVFGKYLQELKAEERKLNAEGEAYDKAQDAKLEAEREEDCPF